MKSLIWTPDNTILYNTINHIKYGFLNSETGILKCVENPGYILKVIQLLLFNKLFRLRIIR